MRQLEDARRRLLHQRDELPAASQLVRIDWRLIERQAREKREKLGIVAGSRRCSIPCGIRTFTLY